MATRQRAYGYGRLLHEPMLRGDLSAWLGWSPERIPATDILAGWKKALAQRGGPGSPATVQLYTHFPFCQSSCRFCQYFHVVPRDSDQMTGYTNYLVALLGRYRAALGRIEISNAYFGGGTPSALPTAELSRFVEAFEQSFHVRNQFTCEAHPGNLDEEKLRLLHRVGVNRLSMGLQSFDPAVLKRIGRVNPPLPRVKKLVRHARGLGMWTNTDLVLGLPGQTADSLRADLDWLLTEGRPDGITVYRYQPVVRLPDAPVEEMRYSRVLTPWVVLRAFLKGYLAETTGGDDRPGKDFLRNSVRTWRTFIGRLWYEAAGMLQSDAELNVYALFENNCSHILGLGPGAISHIYGHSWCRDATNVANLSARTEPVYLGTRLTPEDECRSALLQGLAESRWIDTRTLERRSGVDVRAAFDALLKDGVRSGALRHVNRWYSCAPDVSPATHPTFFEGLLPPTALDAGHALEISELRTDNDVQKELVAIGGEALGLDDTDECQETPGTSSARSDEALLAWAQLIGLGMPGQTFADATIDRLGRGEAHFRVLAGADAVLRLIVEWERGQPSYFHAGPYSISYAPRENQSLTPSEERFLHELRRRTTEALALAPADSALTGTSAC